MSTDIRIAFGHKSRVGKDTACEFLQEKYGGQILRFSEPIYDIVKYAHDVVGIPYKKSPNLMQAIGEHFRQENSEAFINCMKIPKSGNVYVADLRHFEEARFLKENGFILCDVNRKKRPIDRDPNHISEIDLDYFDFDLCIDNDGSIAEFQEKIDKMIIAEKFSLIYRR